MVNTAGPRISSAWIPFHFSNPLLKVKVESDPETDSKGRQGSEEGKGVEEEKDPFDGPVPSKVVMVTFKFFHVILRLSAPNQS